MLDIDTDLASLPVLDVLPNGSHLLARRPHRPKGSGVVETEIVLCRLPWNRYHPYATWQNNVRECVGTYWGHYFSPGEAHRAIHDFNSRGH